MIEHYLKIALRNLAKYRVQSLISCFGLAVGLAFFVFGLHWYRYETSYDTFYPLARRTYLPTTSVWGYSRLPVCCSSSGCL